MGVYLLYFEMNKDTQLIWEQYSSDAFPFKQPGEEWHEGSWGLKIGGNDFEGKVKDLIKKTADSPVQKISVDSVKRLSFFTPDYASKESDSVMINNKWKNLSDLTDEEKEEFEARSSKEVDGVDLAAPIIIVVDDSGKPTHIVDGSHRIAKAAKLGKETLPAKVFTEKEVLTSWREFLS